MGKTLTTIWEAVDIATSGVEETMNGRVTTADSWDSSRSIRFTHYRHTKEQRNNVNKATATASLSTVEIATRSD